MKGIDNKIKETTLKIKPISPLPNEVSLKILPSQLDTNGIAASPNVQITIRLRFFFS